MKNVIRWILTPLAFPAGMILGHLFGLINASTPVGVVRMALVGLVCGAASAMGSILLPILIAPSNKRKVGIIAFWCQVVISILSIACAIALYTIQFYTTQELLEYAITMIGCVGGIVHSRRTLIEEASNW